LALISRNTHRRRIVASRLKPASGESGLSVMTVSFLHLQPELNQAADRVARLFSASFQICNQRHGAIAESW
jgi:hypothetical protein